MRERPPVISAQKEAIAPTLLSPPHFVPRESMGPQLVYPPPLALEIALPTLGTIVRLAPHLPMLRLFALWGHIVKVGAAQICPATP
jgi:hypothetical protein